MMKGFLSDAEKIVRYQAGLGLLELLIALGLGLLIAMLAGSVFLASQQAYRLQDEAVRVQDSGRYALEVVGRAIREVSISENRQAGDADGSASMIRGFDHHSLQSTSPDIQQPLAKSVNGSDILALRFTNHAADGKGDYAALNCAGFATDQPEVWSIFYLAKGHTGEPELYCKYQGKHAWATAAIARGVESFQVLYGVSDLAGGVPVRYVTATQIDQLDQQTDVASSRGSAARRSYWHLVTEIRIALLVRGSQMLHNTGAPPRYDLFGAKYADQYSAADPGTRIDEATLPVKERNRLRRIFTTTIRLRHPVQEQPS